MNQTQLIGEQQNGPQSFLQNQDKKTKVIFARWFDKNVVTINQIFNIFSAFGNIDKVIYLKEKSSALIQFNKVEYAVLAKEYLQHIEFQG